MLEFLKIFLMHGLMKMQVFFEHLTSNYLEFSSARFGEANSILIHG